MSKIKLRWFRHIYFFALIYYFQLASHSSPLPYLFCNCCTPFSYLHFPVSSPSIQSSLSFFFIITSVTVLHMVRIIIFSSASLYNLIKYKIESSLNCNACWLIPQVGLGDSYNQLANVENWNQLHDSVCHGITLDQYSLYLHLVVLFIFTRSC